MKQQIVFVLLFAFSFSACKKQVNSLNPQSPSDRADYVMTPEGMRPASQVHEIEMGSRLSIQNGRIYKVEGSSGRIIEDYGVVPAGSVQKIVQSESPKSSAQHNSANLVNRGPLSPQANGWTIWAQWENTTGSSITSFKTSCVVPSNPSTNNGQLLYFFEGLEDNGGDVIIQPVLQYGTNDIFGGDYWVMSNWYVWSGGAAYTTPTTETPGNVLIGTISYNSVSGGSYSYNCSMTDGTHTNTMTVADGDSYNSMDGGSISLPSIPQMTYAFETMETYHSTVDGFVGGVVSAASYPTNYSCNMYDISLILAAGGTPISWTTDYTPANRNYGESALVINTALSYGEVDLYEGVPPNVTTTASGSLADLYEGNASITGTISGAAGLPVHVNINTFAKDAGLTQSVVFGLTSGATFYSEGSPVTGLDVTNGTGVASFIMPSSGSVTYGVYYTQTGGSSHPYDGASVAIGTY